MSCTTYRSIQIDFTEPDIKPANGYIVKWRVIGTTDWNTVTPNSTSTPAIIPYVPDCANIEGTIATLCDGGTGSTVSFVVSTGDQTPKPCSYYTLMEPNGDSDALSIYRYVPCGTTEPITKSISGGKSLTTGVCADTDMGVQVVFGLGEVKKEGPCTTDNPVTIQF
jgi:hypothetical protein